MSPLALVRSAFGQDATLYDALHCAKDASQAELKTAYRRAALRYHPDRQQQRNANQSHRGNASEQIKEATLKFQAVSAAYEILMDIHKRAAYDTSGQVHTDEQWTGADVSSSAQHQQERWDEFFHSVFNDILTAGSEHGDADSYRGSKKENEDVLKYYQLCKGDMNKILNCVVFCDLSDKERWSRDIIEPAILRGEVERCGSSVRTVSARSRNLAMTCAQNSDLIDSDEEGDNKLPPKIKRKQLGKKGLQRKKSRKVKAFVDIDDEDEISSARALVDTDDEDGGDGGKAIGKKSAKKTSMDRRDKMEYRVAKKRKKQAEKEIEIAGIIKSKGWKRSVGAGPIRQQRQGTFSDALLTRMEKKYSSK